MEILMRAVNMDGKWFCVNVFAFTLILNLEAFHAFPTDGELVVKLVSGFSEMSGRVEVGYNWNPKRYPICNDDFGIHAAQVVCHSLGFDGTPRIAKTGFFGRMGQNKWLTNLRCRGTETKLEDCPSGNFTNTCRRREDAGVFCTRRGVKIIDQPDPWEIPNPMVCGVDMSHKIVQQPTFIELNEITNADRDLLVPKTNIPQDVIERIAKPEIIDSTARFPWIAVVRYYTGDKGESMYICGATIISEFFVLTTARCASRSLPENGFIRVGDFDTSLVDEYERDFRILRISTSVENEGDVKDRDIGLIQIKPDESGKGIAFSQFVLPACLPTAYTPYLKSMICTIGGYGRDHTFRETQFLRIGSVPLLARDTCRESEGSHNYLKKGMFCAGGMAWSSTGCSGDRGSPLICKIKDRSVLMGVDSISGCGTPAKISYYVDIQYHLVWISEAIKNMTSTTAFS